MKDSDIRYGAYTQKSLSADTLNKIAYYIGNMSSSSDAFVPEITFLITWNRIQLTSNPADVTKIQNVASF